MERIHKINRVIFPLCRYVFGLDTPRRAEVPDLTPVPLAQRGVPL